jgi:hypothetical protein
MTADDNLPLTNREKAHYTNWWCRTIGIRSKDIDSHPQIDDVILLIRWHRECWLDSTKPQRGIWCGYWSAVYHKQLPLKAKALKKLEAATQDIITRQQARQLKQQRIRQLRESNQQKGIVHMTANPIPAANLLTRIGTTVVPTTL